MQNDLLQQSRFFGSLDVLDAKMKGPIIMESLICQKI